AGAAGPAAVSWATYHGDLARAGAAATGPALGRARRLWRSAVDGDVYAEPLVVGSRVVAATENNTVYALDAASGRRLWSNHLGSPVSRSALPCGNIDPTGITGTPVVDPARGVVYALAFVAEPAPRHVLFALDLRSGRVLWRRAADAPRADPRVHQQRAALTLSRGRIYVAYGGLFGDCGDYHGAVVGLPASGRGAMVSFRVPSQREAGIWATPGPSVDAAGNLYVATGNSSSTGEFDDGNAVIRLSSALRPGGYFADARWVQLNQADLDLGSVSPLVLPGGRLFVGGKAGDVYLLDARRLGGVGHPVAHASLCAAFGGFAYRAGVVYVPCEDGIAAVRVTGGRIRKLWQTHAADRSPI